MASTNKWKAGYKDLTRRMGEYSAQPAFEESAQAGMRLLRQPMTEQIEGLRGNQVGRGRLRTGFGFQEEDRMVRDIYNRFTDQLASRALSAQQLELQARGLEGDLLSGGWDRRTAAQNAKRKRRGGLLGALGGVAGFAVGGPLGAYLGGKLGGAVGEYV